MFLRLLKLAWRNIWRNKRRALITIASVGLSLFFVLFYQQFTRWSYDQMIDLSIASNIGHVQITDTGYVDEEIMDNALALENIPLEKLRSLKSVKQVMPRIVSGAVASIGLKSKSTGVLGIIPSVDNEVLKFDKKLVDGELLKDGEDGIVISLEMSQFYHVKPGDSLILMSQGYQGYMASGIYPIKGIIDIFGGETNNMVYMTTENVQSFYGAEEMATAIIINGNDSKDVETLKAEVEALIDDPSLTVRTWYEVVPELQQGIAFSASTGKFIGAILYMIVAFGIFGTIVMLYNERTFEFGVISAIGFKKTHLLISTIFELLILVLIGVLAGNIIVAPIVLYMAANPFTLTGEMAEAAKAKGTDVVMAADFYPDIVLQNSLIIMAVAAVMSLYFVFKIVKLNPLEAMRTK